MLCNHFNKETSEKAAAIIPSYYLDEGKKVPLVSLNILKEYKRKVKCIIGQKMNDQSSNTLSNIPVAPQELSPDVIVKLCTCTATSSSQEFCYASELLSICQQAALLTGDPLKRVVYYFAKALQERIIREIRGVVLSEVPEVDQTKTIAEEPFTSLQPVVVECQYELPFCQISQYTAIQAILDNVAYAKGVHLVDLGIKTGSHWPMMQALADRHDRALELLKITAVGPSKKRIEEIGKMLSSFAENTNIPFVFKVVVSEIKNLKEDSFELETDEVLAVHSRFHLGGLLAWPDQLVSLVETIKKLNPCVMVVTEIEANTNTHVFMDRFNAALSLCVAVSDCLEHCMDNGNQCRTTIEEVFMCKAIQNLITTEGATRHVAKKGLISGELS
ncbi:hypothetical protein ACH5RR_033348 [Cinchona calisaya]|uniref:DELLA protein n=1 Tax=Cinchona calisaya TaxID=153742 RepID=A0ABD2YKN6_9GENT